MRRSASEVIRNLESRVARLERSSARGYEDDRGSFKNWIFFIHKDTRLEKDSEGRRRAEELKKDFEVRVNWICSKNDLNICYDDGVFKTAFKAYNSIAGYKNSLRDYHHPDSKKLEKLVKRDELCNDLAESIDLLPLNLGLR